MAGRYRSAPATDPMRASRAWLPRSGLRRDPRSSAWRGPRTPRSTRRASSQSKVRASAGAACRKRGSPSTAQILGTGYPVCAPECSTTREAANTSALAGRSSSSSRLKCDGEGGGDLAKAADSAADGRRDADDGRLAGPCRRQVAAIQQSDVDRRDIFEAGHAILRERAVEDPTVGKPNRLEQRAAEALD